MGPPPFFSQLPALLGQLCVRAEGTRKDRKGPETPSEWQRNGNSGSPAFRYARENLELWRPTDYDQSKTSATTFWIEAAGADAFGHAMPLHTPKLETNEEFVVVRSKRRPVIVVCPPPQAPQVHRIRGGGRVYRRLAMVVPVYSLMSRHTGQLKYDPGFVEQLRILAYPEFLYLPPHPGILPYPSVARLAELQAVYEPHLDPRDLRLADEALRLFQDQLLFRVNGRYGGYLELYREQLMNP